ncbi:asparagine synthase (glutamine-hydrolyzing) [Candidatus Dojkabacteria bacterium]|uniref:asparagine synthase (glutamine-hydrolyzing) n=1 Tax=Candidatus Dojkabacteria bacterium TaxID=2099670 RepID=A0A3M0YYV6_9BACT|nr:MAG: asparagine synthase (glutamine-hydrolyzing) [Candidatus Dojkabacteria bacterium]
MCGIVGFSGSPDPQRLKRMTQSIFHRGPDDESLYQTDNFSVGFRRLSIVDLSKNIYPVSNEDASVLVFLNGEIYNYQALRKELKDLGHKFKTNSDTEVIAHGYEEWGENVVSKLRGMFVYIIHDKKIDELFIARDRLGIKPFYYSVFNDRIVFASEIKALFAGFEIDRSANENSVFQFLAYRLHDIDSATFYANVKRLLPGHKLHIDRMGNYHIEKYWFPRFNSAFSSSLSDKEYSDAFRNKFIETVKLHMIGDVPIGTTLSGGLDSSGVTSLAATFYKEIGSNESFYTFSAIHPGETVNEEEFIDSVVKFCGANSIKVIPKVDDFWRDLDLWLYFQEEPVISAAPYAYFTVMREARKYVTVILSGQGGDELLAGYIPYFVSYWQSAWDQGKPMKALVELFKGRDLYLKYILKKIDMLFSRKSQIRPIEFLNKPKSYEKPEFKHKRNLNERLFEDVNSTTTQCLLRYEDKNSMANSLESRVPFYDHEMVEFIFNLPIDQKIKNGWNRYVYRNALKGLMPEKNRLRRSKIGFTNPEWEWIERRQQNFFEVFSSAEFRSRKFWNADKILEGFKKALKNQLRGDILFFWRVFSVEMWLRNQVDNFEVLDTSKLIQKYNQSR